MSDDMPPTPEGRLIRRVRERAIPKLTIRAAAARIGMSAEQWGYVERGYVPARGGKPPRRLHPLAPTLARMASAVGITPGELEPGGENGVERPDAAELLREILRSQSAPPAPPPSGPGADADADRGDAAARIFPDDPAAQGLLRRGLRLGDLDELAEWLEWQRERAARGFPQGRRDGTAG